MTKISKYLMKSQIEERMFEVFWKTIADLNTIQEVEGFFEELLTPVEQVMLAKRLAISILLIKKYSYKEIVNLLKVSPVTIGNIARWLNTKGHSFQHAIAKIIKQEKQEEFWDNLEQYMSELLPPGKGVNWKMARKKQMEKLHARRNRRSHL